MCPLLPHTPPTWSMKEKFTSFGGNCGHMVEKVKKSISFDIDDSIIGLATYLLFTNLRGESKINSRGVS